MFTSEHDKRADGTWDESRQTAVETICPYCGVGCTLTLHVQDNEIVKVTSPFDASVTSGNLCIKGRFGWQYVQHRPTDATPTNGAGAGNRTPPPSGDATDGRRGRGGTRGKGGG
jgi:NADH dehydrogenase/NADH:ubiquinone oxidoreductase subunit G